jgi:hypothetical protein
MFLPFIHPSARQLVGKTRWVFRRPKGSNPENHPIAIIARIDPFGREPLRLTEDPAGLPYKLASTGLDKSETYMSYRI